MARDVDVLTETVIRRPCAEVAAYAGDPSNAPEWYANISSVEWQTPPPVAVGSRMDFVASFLGRRRRGEQHVLPGGVCAHRVQQVDAERGLRLGDIGRREASDLDRAELSTQHERGGAPAAARREQRAGSRSSCQPPAPCRHRHGLGPPVPRIRPDTEETPTGSHGSLGGA